MFYNKELKNIYYTIQRRENDLNEKLKKIFWKFNAIKKFLKENYVEVAGVKRGPG